MRHKEWKMGTMVERIQPVGPSNILNNMVQVLAAFSEIPKQRGTKSELATSCLLRGPKESGNVMPPLHSRGSPTKGTKSDLKTYATGNNDAPSISKHGSLVRANAQIAAFP